MKNSKKVSTKVAVFGYVFSNETDHEKREQQLKNQRESIHSFCKANGLKDAQIFCDMDSTTELFNRPGFCALHRSIYTATAEKKILLLEQTNLLVHQKVDSVFLVQTRFEKEVEVISIFYPKLSKDRLRSYLNSSNQPMSNFFGDNGSIENLPITSKDATANSPAIKRTRNGTRIPRSGRHVLENVERSKADTRKAQNI